MKMIDFKRCIWILLFIGILSNSENAFGQRTPRCYMCIVDIYPKYSDENQKNDFDSLTVLDCHKDSIRLLQRIVQHNCENEIGKKSLLVLDEMIKENLKVLNGEWIFECLGSNWGIGDVRVGSVQEKITITAHKIQYFKNNVIQNDTAEICCIGLDYRQRIYFLIKIDKEYWKFYLKKEITNRSMSRDIVNQLKEKGPFLYVEKYGTVCGGAEFYYWRIK